jgi:hypothetical protein
MAVQFALSTRRQRMHRKIIGEFRKYFHIQTLYRGFLTVGFFSFSLNNILSE